MSPFLEICPLDFKPKWIPSLGSLSSRKDLVPRVTSSNTFLLTVADPEFSFGGRGAKSQRPILLQIFCRKLHENKIIWTSGRVPGSANALVSIIIGDRKEFVNSRQQGRCSSALV